MKKELIISLLAIFLIATPALARQENRNENSTKNNETKENHKKDKGNITLTPTSIPSPTQAEEEEEEEEVDEDESPSASPACSPTVEYKNHGQYVSCVAREKRGGKEVSEAARSDIGKKHEDNDDEDNDDENEITPTVSPITSSLPTIQYGFNPLKSIEDLWERFASFFKHINFRV